MTAPDTAFALDPNIAAVSVMAGPLGLSDLRLMDDARYPWLILVPRIAGAVEIIDLAKRDRAILFEEITAVSTALRSVTSCEKLNVAALGNQVRQLHVHVVARFHGDSAWPGPIWGVGHAVAYRADVRDMLIAKIMSALRA